ncbi:hypothetical protein B484DRAFT_445497 [Ochromonadaceae sp. CCMP2298]|nr:hypothetical protein B484DRAFT_445497 [Ochromonadaceae sp. CCMP2298]
MKQADVGGQRSRSGQLVVLGVTGAGQGAVRVELSEEQVDCDGAGEVGNLVGPLNEDHHVLSQRIGKVQHHSHGALLALGTTQQQPLQQSGTRRTRGGCGDGSWLAGRGGGDSCPCLCPCLGGLCLQGQGENLQQHLAICNVRVHVQHLLRRYGHRLF